ncbi:MAG: hypothetical protein GY699_20460 [Desulfobacteraceae bacterium]|nr:hypothetical protein [Desulfobacteraceae bacterium]
MNEVKFKMRTKDYEILNHIGYLNDLEVGEVIQGLNNFALSSGKIKNQKLKQSFNNLLYKSFQGLKSQERIKRRISK